MLGRDTMEPTLTGRIIRQNLVWNARGMRIMGSSREYWLYAKECAKWAAETKNKEDQDLFIDIAKAWTNIALVETDVAKRAPEELQKTGKRSN
jgi:hypothetical protein